MCACGDGTQELCYRPTAARPPSRLPGLPPSFQSLVHGSFHCFPSYLVKLNARSYVSCMICFLAVVAALPALLSSNLPLTHPTAGKRASKQFLHGVSSLAISLLFFFLKKGSCFRYPHGSILLLFIYLFLLLTNFKLKIFFNYGKKNAKFTITVILSVRFSGVKYIYYVQPCNHHRYPST